METIKDEVAWLWDMRINWFACFEVWHNILPCHWINLALISWSAGTVWTATAHIVAALIGSGVLALAWSVAQLGWVVGPLVLLGFSCITYYTSALLANCYRFPDPITGTINRAYIDAVRSYLGEFSVLVLTASAASPSRDD